MLKLHGMSQSNYYNAAKMALLEKGAEFEEVKAFPSQKDDYLPKSPMGKVPCLETPQGFLSETSVIIDYVDQAIADRHSIPKIRGSARKHANSTSCRTESAPTKR